ncbi:MAG: DUF1640 domain-containing protein [Gammaproteobacteria bacterium]|nr:DUF1640 domain-containing protein [Gammaproteobacteria bacterium]
MQEVSFDTHAAIRKLEGAGCPAPQAEAMVAVVSQATSVTSRMARDLERIKLQVDTNMATRSDLADLRTETREGFASLKAEIEERVENRIETLRTETQEGFASMRTETLGHVESLRTETQKGFESLRTETLGHVESLRTETQKGFESLRTETLGHVESLRTETQKGFESLRTETLGHVESLRTETRQGFASMRTEFKDQMVTKGELYRALWIQGGVLATLILSFGAMTLGIALYAFSGS